MNSSQPSQSTLCCFGLNACSNAMLANALYKTGKRRKGRVKTNNVVLTLPHIYLIIFCLIVGGNLLSHTLPGAVPSARAGLASGFGMGNRAFPCRYRHRQIIGTTCSDALGVLCQILHSGRVHTGLALCACFCLCDKS